MCYRYASFIALTHATWYVIMSMYLAIALWQFESSRPKTLTWNLANAATILLCFQKMQKFVNNKQFCANKKQKIFRNNENVTFRIKLQASILGQTFPRLAIVHGI